MSEEAVKVLKRAREPKIRKFFLMDRDYAATRAPGYRIENKTRLLRSGRILGPEPGRRGFPNYPEAPRVLIDTKFGRPLRDWEECSQYWLISDRMKAVLEEVDPQACAFVKCEMRLRNCEPGPGYWLCDVVRVLDAVEEAESRVKIYDERGDKTYSLMGGARLVFKEDVVRSAHIFRMAHLEPAVVCDQKFKDAYKAAGLRGISFRDAANY